MRSSFFDVIRCLAQPTRFEIYQALGYDGATGAEIAKKLGISRATVSVHLAALREMKLVSDNWRGRQHVHRWPAGERLVLAVQRVPATPETVTSAEGS